MWHADVAQSPSWMSCSRATSVKPVSDAAKSAHLNPRERLDTYANSSAITCAAGRCGTSDSHFGDQGSGRAENSLLETFRGLRWSNHIICMQEQ